MMLEPLMCKYNSFILTEKTSYLQIEDQKQYIMPQINRREPLFILKLLWLSLISLFVFIKEKPDYIISTGALCTIPIILIAKLFRKRIIFIESFSKINSGTISGKIAYKFADLFIIQWESLTKLYPKAKYWGGIY
jgi:beta-1,4-N-acetylglucosaminyltransferase